MCLIAFAWRSHPDYPLIVAANRDEFFARPTEPAGFWSDHPDVLAGRDGLAHGTWLGVTRTGRFSALTNFRAPQAYRPDAKSRGALVADFLTEETGALAYLDEVKRTRTNYNPFNLIAGTDLAGPAGVLAVMSHASAPAALKPGVYALSNASLDTPWPKVVAARRGLENLLRQTDPARPDFDSGLWQLLADERRAADHELPDTGIPLELERALSAAHIRLPEYGTRSATLLVIAGSGTARLAERSFPAHGDMSERRFSFELERS